jgi:hypothetical protein
MKRFADFDHANKAYLTAGRAGCERLSYSTHGQLEEPPNGNYGLRRVYLCMNAKVKLIAAIAALQLIVPAVFAQPVVTLNSIYTITGRVIQVDPRTIVIRSRGPVSGDFVILRRENTRFYSQVRPGDLVTIKYNMMATDVSLAAPERVVVPRHRY